MSHGRRSARLTGRGRWWTVCRGSDQVDVGEACAVREGWNRIRMATSAMSAVRARPPGWCQASSCASTSRIHGKRALDIGNLAEAHAWSDPRTRSRTASIPPERRCTSGWRSSDRPCRASPLFVLHRLAILVMSQPIPLGSHMSTGGFHMAFDRVRAFVQPCKLVKNSSMWGGLPRRRKPSSQSCRAESNHCARPRPRRLSDKSVRPSGRFAPPIQKGPGGRADSLFHDRG
jgi:hypothetical protein